MYHYETPGVEYPYWDQGYYTAFLDFNDAMDSGRYQYFPVAAHELPHTYRFGDIYDGYTIVMLSECVYFDEFNGGVIKNIQGTIILRGYTLLGLHSGETSLPAESKRCYCSRHHGSFWRG